MWLYTVLSSVCVLCLIVVVPAYGHYLVARYYGIPILCVSLGVGPQITSYISASGIRWRWGLIPFASYISFSDMVHGKQVISSWVCICITLAGPLIQCLFAWIVLTGVGVVGTKQWPTRIDTPIMYTEASKAGVVGGEIVLSVNQEAVHSWSDIHHQIMKSILYQNTLVELLVYNEAQDNVRTVILPLTHIDINHSDYLSKLGLRRYMSTLISSVEVYSIADQVGLKANDQVLSINDIAVSSWGQVHDFLRYRSPDDQLSLEVKTANGERKIVVIPAEEALTIGIKHLDAMDMVNVRYSVLESMWRSCRQISSHARSYMYTLMHFFMGDISWQHLAGPIYMVENIANTSMIGFEAVILLIVFLNIQLAMLNILPLPMLDGGHLVYHLCRVIKKYCTLQLSLSLRSIVRLRHVVLCGLALVFMRAMGNDLYRLFW